MTLSSPSTARFARINGIDIAFRVQGEGPPLVLIMGYRLSSAAWPAQFVETLAKHFTVITFDNRGTGHSDKPVTGYALANMACDVGDLLDEIGIENTYVVGYSMGGAIAQEFVRQFPDRVTGLILCATMCGGPRATYAEPSVVRVMRDLKADPWHHQAKLKDTSRGLRVGLRRWRNGFAVASVIWWH
jgi:pimeloyl-ACP methyl ester carboxylesterase